MTNLTKLAAIALLALGASTTFASAAFVNGPAILVVPGPAPQGQPTVHRAPADIECKARGADFYIINFGSDNLESGRQIAWNSPSTDDSGVILLPKMLAPGDSVKLADVLSDLALPGARCSAGLV